MHSAAIGRHKDNSSTKRISFKPVSDDAGGPTWFKVACSPTRRAHPGPSFRILARRGYLLSFVPNFSNMMDKSGILDLRCLRGVDRHTWWRIHVPCVARRWSIIVSPPGYIRSALLHYTEHVATRRQYCLRHRIARNNGQLGENASVRLWTSLSFNLTIVMQGDYQSLGKQPRRWKPWREAFRSVR